MSRAMIGMCCVIGALAGCASDWKIHGGPQECVAMCQHWNMNLVGMVGVGSQDRTGGGATACVCEMPTSGGQQVTAGASGISSSTGAVAVMLAEQRARRQQQQQGRR